MDIAIYSLRAVAEAITNPELVFVLVLLGVMLYSKNKKTTAMQRMIIGENLDSAFELTISQIVIGILAGAVCSLILSYLGVMFDENSAIYIVFMVSILFMFWKPRFVCFAYSGSLIGFLSLGLSAISVLYTRYYPAKGVQDFNIVKVDIVALMTMVAVMHFVEAILVLLDGKKGAMPVFTSKDNKIIGGFALQRYWALPIALIFLVHSTGSSDTGTAVSLPNWWPLIKTSMPLNLLKDAAISLAAFYGVIGYSSVTFTKTKGAKVASSSIGILVYSLALFVLAQLASYGVVFKVIVLLFAPIGHELMIKYQQKKEDKDPPIYVSAGGEGVMVLEVAPNSPAQSMGIVSRDIIVEINNLVIETEMDILKAIKQYSNRISVKIKKINGEIKELSYENMDPNKRLGVVFIPKAIPDESAVMRVDNEVSFTQILKKIKNKNEKKDENDSDGSEDKK